MLLLIVLQCLTATTSRATEAHDNVAALVDNAKSMSLRRTGTVSTVDVLSGTDPVPSFATSMCFQASWAVAPLVKVELSPTLGVGLDGRSLQLSGTVGGGLTIGPSCWKVALGFSFTTTLSANIPSKVAQTIHASTSLTDFANNVKDGFKHLLDVALKNSPVVQSYEKFLTHVSKPSKDAAYNVVFLKAIRQARNNALWLRDDDSPYEAVGTCEKLINSLRDDNLHRLKEYCAAVNAHETHWKSIKFLKSIKGSMPKNPSTILNHQATGGIEDVFKETNELCKDTAFVQAHPTEYVAHCELMYGFGRLLPGTLFTDGVANEFGQTVGRATFQPKRLGGLIDLDQQVRMSHRANAELEQMAAYMHFTFLMQLAQKMMAKKPTTHQDFVDDTEIAWYRTYTDILSSQTGYDANEFGLSNAQKKQPPCDIDMNQDWEVTDNDKKSFDINQDPEHNVIMTHGINSARKMVCTFFSYNAMHAMVLDQPPTPDAANTYIREQMEIIYRREDRLHWDTIHEWWDPIAAMKELTPRRAARELYKRFALVKEMATTTIEVKNDDGGSGHTAKTWVVDDDTIPMDGGAGADASVAFRKHFGTRPKWPQPRLFNDPAETRLTMETTLLFRPPDMLEEILRGFGKEQTGTPPPAPTSFFEKPELKLHMEFTVTTGTSAIGFCTPDTNPIQIVSSKEVQITKESDYKYLWG